MVTSSQLLALTIASFALWHLPFNEVLTSLTDTGYSRAEDLIITSKGQDRIVKL